MNIPAGRIRRRIIGAVVLAGALYIAVMEIWVARIDPWPATSPTLVIALSSGMAEDGSLDPVGAQRLRTALRLAHEHDMAIITTRVAMEDNDALTSDPAQRRLVDSAGLLPKWRILDGLALTTRDEAERFRRAVPPTRIALVTSRMHTRRACAAFEQMGYDVTCISSGLDGPWWRIPFAVAYESAAWIKYKAKGWI